MEYYESEWNACNFVYKLVIKLIDDYQMIRASEMVRCIVHQKKEHLTASNNDQNTAKKRKNNKIIALVKQKLDRICLKKLN